ncbi:MAG: transporter substrate-binding protein [Devosia sp.]|nr:transporter substrate-binding protein [Devosia sp.]
MHLTHTTALSITALLLSSVAVSAQAVPTLNGETLPQYVAPSDGLLAEIGERGVLVNGIEAQNPPFEYVDDGNIVGFDIDITNLFASRLGVKAEFIDTAWSGVIPSLYTKKFDMIWSAMTITEPRKEAVAFSMPYASDKVEFIVSAGNDTYEDIKDFDGKVLGTQLNSAAEFQAKELIAEHGLEIELKSFDSFQGAYLDLRNGNVDAVTSTQLNNRQLFDANPGVFEVALELPIYNYVGVAVRQQDQDLLAEIDAFIAEMKESGELSALQEKWFGYAMDLPTE